MPLARMTVLGWDDSHPADKQSSNDKCEGSAAGDVGATVKCCPFVQSPVHGRRTKQYIFAQKYNVCICVLVCFCVCVCVCPLPL